jgi:hypothetical protein
MIGRSTLAISIGAVRILSDASQDPARLYTPIGKLAEPSRDRLKHGRRIADRDVIGLHCGVEHSLNRIDGEPDLGEFPQFIARKQNTVVSH